MRKAAMRILALLVLVAAVVHAPVSAARAEESTKTMHLAALETAVVRELNRIRVGHNLQPLRPAPSLRTAARSHTKAMLDVGFFGHDSADGTAFSERIKRYYSNRGWQSWSVGEALLASQERQTEASTIVAAWMDSPPHRDIILSPSWRDVGIGALYAPVAPREFGDAQTVAVTADFGLRAKR
jgi:uncharacterized protein YkwD